MKQNNDKANALRQAMLKINQATKSPSQRLGSIHANWETKLIIKICPDLRPAEEAENQAPSPLPTVYTHLWLSGKTLIDPLKFPFLRGTLTLFTSFLRGRTGIKTGLESSRRLVCTR